MPKEGSCPAIKTQGGLDVGICENLCTFDSDCPGSLKCCEVGNSCGTLDCVPPISESCEPQFLLGMVFTFQSNLIILRRKIW